MDSHHILITFVSAASLGVFLLLVANRIKVSAIVVLLIGGILAGPQFLGLVHPTVLGNGLNTIISLSVGIILFEGGLTLDIKGYRQVSSEIWGVLTKGVAITWGVSTIALKLIFQFDWILSLSAASLIIVTGPTVIGPLLQRIRVRKKLHQILYWEGVLIDPIGVFFALLCYEWVISSGAGTQAAFLNFVYRFLVGTVIGVLFGEVLYRILMKRWVPDERLNFFILAMAMLNFMVADLIVVESGVLSVTVAGFLLGYKKPPHLERIVSYKVELKDFLIGLLFILLAANLTLTNFLNYGWKLVAAVVVVMLVVRPLNIFLSTWGSALAFKEKLFLSWIAPRGIVAASMASLFAFQLQSKGMKEAYFLETFTYAVIVGTVIFQGFSAGLVGKILGVLEPQPKDWLIIGAHKLGRSVASFIEKRGNTAILLDTNPREVRQAKKEGFTAICDNAFAVDPENRVELCQIGNVLAITENEDLNRLVCQHWKKVTRKAELYYWESEELESAQDRETLVVGTPIWTWLDIQGLLADHMHQELEIFEKTKSIKALKRMPKNIICEYNNNISPIFPTAKEGLVTYLNLKSTNITTIGPTKRDWVLFSEEKTMKGLFGQMLELFGRDYPQLDQVGILEELIQREEEFTSLIGHGIALPHTYTHAVDESVLSISKVDPPIKCHQTGSDISMVFMVLSPEGDPAKHLQLISKIAKFVMKKANRDAFLKASDSKTLYKIIEEGDQSFVTAE